MSSTPPEWSDKVDGFDFVATEVGPAEIIEAVTTTHAGPAVNEVAIAAANSAFPVAALQYLIDGVHSFTGLNWWASIALTTVIIRGVTISIHFNQRRNWKLHGLRAKLDELVREMRTKTQDPEAMADIPRRVYLLYKEHGVTSFTLLKGLLIQGPIIISFFFAIRNMAEKVPSFKTGGTLWFTDLTTADTTYILPFLTAVTYLIKVESNMQGDLESYPVADTWKKIYKIIVVLFYPVLIVFENALFCYWLTSNLFSYVYGLAIRNPHVRRLLNLTEVVISSTRQPSPSPSSPSSFSFPKPKDQSAAQEKPPMSSCKTSSSVPDRRISRSSVQRTRNNKKR